MLRDQRERGQRSVRRVEVLLGLLSDEDERTGRARGRALSPCSRFPTAAGRAGWHPGNPRPLCFVAAAFLQAAKMRLHDLLKKQEDSYLFNIKQWVVREASNPDALQEAGTFRYREEPPGRAAVCVWGGTGLPCTCPLPHEVRAPRPVFH